MTDDRDRDHELDIVRRFREDLLAAPARRRTSVWRRVAGALQRPLTGRGLAIAVATIAVTGSASAAVVRFVAAPAAEPPPVAMIVAPCTPATPRTAACPNGDTFSATPYIGHGGAYYCRQLARQADAQAVLRADPSDPNGFDEDRDGVACPELPGPKDLTPVRSIVARFRCRASDQRSARCPQPWRAFDPAYYVRYRADVYDCAQFATQADAQAVLRYEPTDPNDLDDDTDGIACPDRPAPKDLAPVVRQRPS